MKTGTEKQRKEKEMEKDVLIEKFFEKGRWKYAIEKGVGKDIRKSELERLTAPEMRIAIYRKIKDGTYNIAPPHTAEIPKPDSNEMRVVMVNEPIDRVLLSIANDLLFETCRDMVHPSCHSYLKGVGCGKVVTEISERICMGRGEEWWKGDLRKYFDRMQRHRIDWVFDEVERRHGHSAVVDMLRRYYHLDCYYDTKLGEYVTGEAAYKSLKQGCSVASFLADAALYRMDKRVSELDVVYARYCDDFVCGGPEAHRGMEIIREELSEVGLELHPNKLEMLSPKKWFKFLGFSIKGSMITMSHARLDRFRDVVRRCTYLNPDPNNTIEKAMRRVYRALYVGDGRFSWGTAVLPVINVHKDIVTMDTYIRDALRAVKTGKHRIGGFGYQITQKDCVAIRYIGQNNKANREKVPVVEGYTTMYCMQRAIQTNRDAYALLVREMMM